MNISLIAYASSLIISLFFIYKIILTLRKKPTDLSRDFFYFFLFGTLYFLIRTLSLILFINQTQMLAFAYPISHIFLYLSFSFMLQTTFDISKMKKYSKSVFYTSLFIGAGILATNFLLLNKPSFVDNLVDWGTNSIVSILHLGYASVSILAIAVIFLYEAFKSKQLNKNYLVIGLGFAILPLSVLKHFFPTSLLYLFEFNMIIGISVVAVGLSIKSKDNVKV